LESAVVGHNKFGTACGYPKNQPVTYILLTSLITFNNGTPTTTRRRKDRHHEMRWWRNWFGLCIGTKAWSSGFGKFLTILIVK
jgi:hypothetical protein